VRNSHSPAIRVSAKVLGLARGQGECLGGSRHWAEGLSWNPAGVNVGTDRQGSFQQCETDRLQSAVLPLRRSGDRSHLSNKMTAEKL